MKVKRLITFTLILLASFSIFANGSSEKDSAASNEVVDADGIVKPKQITIMVDSTVFTKANERDAFEAKWEELTGIDLKFIQPDHDAYYDVVGQTLASGDWPDVILLNSVYYAGYASEGVLWDMTDAYENSELKTRVTSPSTIEGLKLDGSLYGFSPTRGNGCITYIKKAWLDNVGLDAPTTYAEYLNMLDAFTNEDPDGNGIDGDTYAISAAGLIGKEAPYINYLPNFYQDAYPSFYKNANGEWVDGFTEPSMRAALTRLKSAYEAGYIDKESLTNGTKDCRNKYYEDKFGVFTYWAGVWASNLSTNLIAHGHDGELIALPPIKETGTYIERVAPTWCITSSCENPEGVFKYFIETMLDGKDMQFLWTYGVEDVHWSTKAETVCGNTYTEGQFHGRESLELKGTQYKKHHIDPLLAVAPLENDPKALSQLIIDSSTTFNNNSRPAQIVVSTDEMSQYNGDLTTLKNEIVALVVTQGMSVEDGMKKFESDGGLKWSNLIVDSLNK